MQIQQSSLLRSLISIAKVWKYFLQRYLECVVYERRTWEQTMSTFAHVCGSKYIRTLFKKTIISGI